MYPLSSRCRRRACSVRIRGATAAGTHSPAAASGCKNMGGRAVHSWVIWRCGEDDREVSLRMLSVVLSVRLVTLPTTDALWVGVMGSSRSTRGRLEGLRGRDCSMGHKSLCRRRLDERGCLVATSASLSGFATSRSHALMRSVVVGTGGEQRRVRCMLSHMCGMRCCCRIGERSCTTAAARATRGSRFRGNPVSSCNATTDRRPSCFYNAAIWVDNLTYY
jgi:hypothetical protein